MIIEYVIGSVTSIWIITAGYIIVKKTKEMYDEHVFECEFGTSKKWYQRQSTISFAGDL
jgi:hypothetical protein